MLHEKSTILFMYIFYFTFQKCPMFKIQLLTLDARVSAGYWFTYVNPFWTLKLSSFGKNLMYLRRENDILQYFCFLLFKEQKSKVINETIFLEWKRSSFCIIQFYFVYHVTYNLLLVWVMTSWCRYNILDLTI